MIEVSDEVHRRLKIVASARHITLRELVKEALGNAVYIGSDGSDMGWRDYLNDLFEEELTRP